jgi:tryptophanyl-tRNA synthetase
MSLTNPAKKMSKSDTNDKSRILITDDSETIKKKINKAITDSEDNISFDPENRPGLSNLLQILLYAEANTGTPEEIAQELQGVSKRSIKERVSGAVDRLLLPVRERYSEVIQNEKYLDDIAKLGAAKASKNAEVTMKLVKDVIGF